MRNNTVWRRLCLLFSLLVATSIAFAQTPTGTIQANVTDPGGASVSGATVTLTNLDMGNTRILKTDSAGRFEVPLLTPGNYTVTVVARGFQLAQQDRILVQVAQDTAVNFTLSVGTVAQSVQVSATAAGLDTQAATVSTVIGARTIDQLPLNGRNPFNLVEFVPGVSTLDAANGPGNAGTTPHIAGGRLSTSEEQIDGMTNIVPENNVGNSFSAYQPVVDSVQEFSVQTSILPAEFGRFFGAVINVVTKSGTNQLHGSFFEFARNQVLDAKDYFPIGPKPGISRNQFGGTVGGPIFIPHLYNGHNRSFFFFAIEDSRENDSATETDPVPLPAFLNGDFSALSEPIYDPTTVHPTTLPNGQAGFARTQFDYNGVPNTIDLARFSKVGRAALKFFPAPNAGGAGAQVNNYVVTEISKSDYLHYDIRMDHDIRKNWHTFVRYSHLQVNGSGLNDYKNAAAQGGNPLTISVHSLSFDNLITISPNFLTELRYGFSRLDEQSTPYGEGFDPTALGLPASLAAAAEVKMFPTFSFTNGYAGLGITSGYGILLEAPSAHEASASFIRILGSHTIKAGSEFRKLFMNFHQYGFPTGDYPLDQSWTQQYISHAEGSGNPIASLLLGLPNGGQLTSDGSSAQASTYSALYIQDDYRAMRTLTFNLGLRWDAIPACHIHKSIPPMSHLAKAYATAFLIRSMDRSPWLAHQLSQPTIQQNYLLRAFPQYNGVESYRKPTADSTYIALTLKLQKTFSHGFSLLISYTGSKSMDNGAGAVTFLGAG